MSFEKSVGLMTEYDKKHGDNSITLIGKSTGFQLSRVQLENMRLILDDSTWQERYKEDPQLTEGIVRIEKHQDRTAPVIEHLKVQTAKT